MNNEIIAVRKTLVRVFARVKFNESWYMRNFTLSQGPKDTQINR